jgi:hypothetical protein
MTSDHDSFASSAASFADVLEHFSTVVVATFITRVKNSNKLEEGSVEATRKNLKSTNLKAIFRFTRG